MIIIGPPPPPPPPPGGGPPPFIMPPPAPPPAVSPRFPNDHVRPKRAFSVTLAGPRPMLRGMVCVPAAGFRLKQPNPGAYTRPPVLQLAAPTPSTSAGRSEATPVCS